MTVGTAARRAPSGLDPRRLLAWRPNERLVFGLLGFAVVLSIWQFGANEKWFKLVQLSSPAEIWKAAVKDFSTGVIWPHIGVSAQEYLLGLAAALGTGIPLGLAIGQFRRLNYLLDPWLSAIYATPSVALVPLIILIFGIELEAKIVVIWLQSIFVVVVSTISGVHAADAKYHDLAQSFGASAWTRFRTVTLPASVPFILTGVRLGTGQALVGVVIAEFLAANEGIGFYISLNGQLLITSRVFLGIIILGFFGVTIGELTRQLERRFERWRPQIN
jgi:ABC-type nitrate/sulfonate/bicarbonate transport system permease component